MGHIAFGDATAPQVCVLYAQHTGACAKCPIPQYAAQGVYFGEALAGDTLVVGALLDDVNGVSLAGAAYVYQRGPQG